MRLLTSSLLLSCCLFSFFSPLKATAQDECENVLIQLENQPSLSSKEYDKCGFGNEELVWSKWAGYVSEKKMRRAIYEICVRFPNHDYHKLYCDKAVQLEYPLALIDKGEELINADQFDEGYSYLIKALNTKLLTSKQEARLLEVLAVYYLKKNDERSLAYLEKAALKGSALANNILGYNYYLRRNENLGNDRTALEYFWKSVLLDCKKAEENVGLFQLENQGKITYEKALSEMKKGIYSCKETTLDQTATKKDTLLYGCRCKMALDSYQKHMNKSYLLRKIEAKMAVLEDKSGKTISVSEQGNLPNGANVAEVRKTAVILVYPDKEREILNLYHEDACVNFCKDNGIYENLTLEEMRLKIDGAKEGIRIQPYHITFTQPECEFIKHYANQFFAPGADYKGKEECAYNVAPSVDPILNNVSMPQVFVPKEPVSSVVKEEKVEIDKLSSREKKDLIKQAGEALKFD